MQPEVFINILDTFDKKLFEFIIVFLNYDFIVETARFIVQEKKFFPYLLFLFFLYLAGKPKRALLFLTGFILLLAFSELITSSLKDYFFRDRPAVQTGINISSHNYSFPSAHAFNSMALAYFLGFWFSSKKKLFIFISFLIGISRVLSNYHFPLDVLAGWIGGFFFSAIYVQFIILINEKYILYRYQFR